MLDQGDERLEEYWEERYDTNEVPGINYRELEELELHEVDDFTRDMHPLDVGEAVSHAPFPDMELLGQLSSAGWACEGLSLTEPSVSISRRTNTMQITEVNIEQ